MTPLVQREWFVRAIAPVLVGILILAAWQAGCAVFSVPVYLFPAPLDIAQSLVDHRGMLLYATFVTALVTLYALLAAIAIGTLVAFLLVQSRIVEISFLPYAVLFQVTPVVAIAPLIVILVKNALLSKVICATVVAIFPVISNTTIGLRAVDPGLLDYYRMKKAGPLKTLLRLRLPSALPYFLAGLRISSGLSLIGAVVAEFGAGSGGTSGGLAYLILEAGFQLDIPLMFAALTLIALLGIAMFGAVAGLTRLVLGHWHESALREGH
jgi:NitT/TauT family transport system permease protein